MNENHPRKQSNETNREKKKKKKKHKKWQKMSDPNENCTKFASKPSENKKFVRIQHKKVPEMVEKE